MRIKILSLLLISVLAISCKKLPVYEGQYYSEESYNNEFYDYYDPNSKLRYEFYNDDSNLYIKFDTYDMLAKIKILSGGLKICVDTLAKSSENQFIQYPISSKRSNKDFEQEDVTKQFSRKRSLHERIDNLSKMIVILNHKGEQKYNILNSKLDFEVKLSADSIGNLVYEARIPLTYFFPDGINPDKEFSIGIVSGAIELPEPKNRMQNDMPERNGRVGAGQPHGDRGNMGYRPNMNTANNDVIKPIKIWFKTTLKKE